MYITRFRIPTAQKRYTLIDSESSDHKSVIPSFIRALPKQKTNVFVDFENVWSMRNLSKSFLLLSTRENPIVQDLSGELQHVVLISPFLRLSRSSSYLWGSAIPGISRQRNVETFTIKICYIKRSVFECGAHIHVRGLEQRVSSAKTVQLGRQNNYWKKL